MMESNYPKSEISQNQHDPVFLPAHYTTGKIEVWDFIIDQKLNYCLGNVIKYVCRADHKGKSVEDLEKAVRYLQKEIAERRKASKSA